MPKKNYRGSFEGGGDIKMRAGKPDEYAGYAEEKRRMKMQRETIHKAVAAFLSSLVTLLVTVGVVVPEWVTDSGVENVSWLIATLISLFGSSVITGFVYQIPNKRKGSHEGPLGGD